MAIEEKKFLGVVAVEQLIKNTRNKINTGDEETLAVAKQYAEDLGVNYDPAGTAKTKVDELANGAVKENTDAIAKLNGDDSTEGSVAKAVADAKTLIDADVNAVKERVDVLESDVGDVETLETTAKNLAAAVNEVRNAVSVGGTAAAITLDTATTTEGMAKSYTLKQGDNVIGTIDIPKDMVVESGSVVNLADDEVEGYAAGTYIKLVLANANNDVIYVNVGTLVDIYKAQANATQIQLAIDSAAREISATIVAGSVTVTELAADAVTTVKIADGNVTKAKLSASVQASLDKADVAEQNAKDYADSQRLGYTETSVMTYDGNSEGKETFSVLPEGSDYLMPFVRIGDYIDPKTITSWIMVQSGEETQSPMDKCAIEQGEGLFTVGFDGTNYVYCIYADDNEFNVSTGTYVVSLGTLAWVSRIEYETVHKIDPKYIPDELPAIDDAIAKLEESGQIGKEEVNGICVFAPMIYGDFTLGSSGYNEYSFTDSTLATRLEALEGTETTIIVEWDGVLYERKVLKAVRAIYVGNVHLVYSNEPDTGEPFCISTFTNSGGYIELCSTDSKTTHTLACYMGTITIVPIDKKYIPENEEVTNLRSDVDALKAVTYVEITAEEIDAMFDAE